MLTHVNGGRTALLLLALVAAPALAGAPDTDHTWNGSQVAHGWTTPCNWDLCSLPPNSGTAAVHFPAGAAWFQPSVDVLYGIRRLSFEGGGYTLGGSALAIGSGGILMSSASACQMNNPLVVATQTWTCTTPATLTVGTVSLNGASLSIVAGDAVTHGSVAITGAVAGTGSLNAFGPGTVTLSGANSYSGPTLVLGGTLRSGASNVIPPGTVSVRGGTLDLNGFSETIGPGAVSATGLVLGTYPTDGSAPGESTFVLASPASPLGISTLGTFIQYDATGSPGPAFISGALGLGTSSGTRTIDVGDSPAAATELTISADISNPGGVAGPSPVIIKSGAGRLELSGNNTFIRSVSVQGGTLVVASNGALGATGSGNQTQVATGSALELRAGPQLGPERLELNGLGVNGAGALRCVDGSATGSGLVTLVTTSRIRVENGRLALSQVNGVAPFRAYVAGDGAGTFALTGLNNLSGGVVEIEPGGRLSVENLSGSVTGTASVIVDSAGVLTGASPLTGNVVVTRGARVEPGAPIGILGAGTSNLGVGSLLKLELAGPLPSQYDRFQVANNLTVSGDLEVVLTNGFVPAIGDTFILVTAGSAFPQFQHGTAPPLPPDRAWQFAHLGNKLVARVIAAASVGVDPAAPARTALLGAAPNPFTIETAIGFELSRPGRVDLELFDTRGRRVAVLLQGANLPAGRHSARWSGRDQGGGEAGPGIYWARMRVDGAWVEPSRRLVRSP